MRQFVLGLIVAALAWWGYDTWTSKDGQPVGDVPAAPAGAGGAAAPDYEDLLQSGGPPVRPATGDVAEGPVVASDASTRRAPDAPDTEQLLAGIAGGDIDAIGRAWIALARGGLGADRARLVAALQPEGTRFDEQLRVLGAHNAFLHSTEGRAVARQVLVTAMALPDPEALQAGSQLLYLMSRGRIERADTAVRAVVDEAYAQHRIRVDRWLCNPTNVAGARSYTVQSGDNLDGIARSFRKQELTVEAGTIQVLNRISNPRALRVGQQLKVPVAPIRAILEKRSYALMVFVGNELLRLYWVGHGENDRTPVTTFTVVAKQAKPDWTAPDGHIYPYGHPKNILGEYFIKFSHPQYSGFGAHGTPMPDTICTQSSMGCIRMFDQDIDELFRILPRGAEVIVRATGSLR